MSRRRDPGVVVVATPCAHAVYGTLRRGDLLPADHPLAKIVACEPWQPPELDDLVEGAVIALSGAATAVGSIRRGDILPPDHPAAAGVAENAQSTNWSPPPVDPINPEPRR